MTVERMDFDGGKYTVINDNGTLSALRYGQPWGRDLVGDNLVYWMFVEARNLKEQRDSLLAALTQCLPIVDAHRRNSLGEGDMAAAFAREVIAKVNQ